VRSAFTKHGGALGETNSVSFMFQRLGVVTYKAAAATADAMLEAAIEAGADDVVSDGESHEVTCAIESLFALRDALEQRFGPPEEAKFDWRPATLVTLDEERAVAVLKLIDVLEDNDDVQNVYANYDIPEEIAARLDI
jgi:transcriptional/translational regulatory protein YebC/TACO1